MERFQSLKQYLPIIGIISATLVFLLLSFTLPVFFPKKKLAIIGIFHVNGVIPPGSTITLLEREKDTTGAFIPIATNLTPLDLASWKFTKADPQKSYDLKAELITNGSISTSSASIQVSAPAVNQVLTILLPQAPTGHAMIPGFISTNGYIPKNASVLIELKKTGSLTTSQVLFTLTAAPKLSFNFDTAVSGQVYGIQAELIDQSKKSLGISPLLTISAPAPLTTFTIQSSASQPVTLTNPPPTPIKSLQASPSGIPLTITPTVSASTSPVPVPTVAPNASMSGTITFTGQAQLNARIVIFERVSGTTTYQLAADNIVPKNNSAWTWSGAQSGTSYDLIAIVKQKQSNGTDVDLVDSNVLSLAAPTTTAVFTVVSTTTLAAPAPNISVTCNTINGGTQLWPALVNIQTINGAASYWIEIGTTDGGTDLANTTQNANSGTKQVFSELLKNGTTYYAKFAYAAVSNLTGGDAQFSPLSTSAQIHCP